MQGKRKQAHPHEPEPALDQSQPWTPEASAAEHRNQPVGDAHKGEGHGGPDGQMEMADDIGGVVHHQIQTIGGIHQAHQCRRRQTAASPALAR